MNDADCPMLLDCPFCGSTAYYRRGHGTVHMVNCSICAAEMLSSRAETVIGAWNRRVVTSGKPEVPGT